jgi:hypothetical protein
MEKILGITDRICLFCGEKEKEKWDEYEKYFECDCLDSIETRNINEAIEKLKKKRPQPRYKISKEYVIRKI